MLQQHCFSLAVRALAAGDGAARHARGTLALHPAGGGEPVDAAAFMPAAVRVGLAAECDVQAVRLGLDWLTKADAQLLVCLSWSSLGQDDFLGRLRQLLADRPVQAARLWLEAPALSLVHQRDDVLALSRMLAETATGLCLSGLAQQPAALEYLHQLPKLSCIRLEGAFAQTLSASPGNRRLAEAIIQTASSLGAQIHADYVDDDASRVLLREQGACILREGDIA